MADLSAGKIAEVLFENALETYETQDKMIDLVDSWEPDQADLQNSENYIWRSVEQSAPVLEGWDLTGSEQGIIQETYPAILGLPKGDLVEMRVDRLRDMTFWKNRGKASGRKQATALNTSITNAMVTQGSMFYRSSDTSGFDFISEAQALMNERQGKETMRNYLLNDRAAKKYAENLAARQTLQGRPELVWKKGQITQNTASFDVYTGSFLPQLVGGASPDTTVTGNQSFAPEVGSVDAATGVVTNIDYRSATIPVAASTSYNVGDKVKFTNDPLGTATDVMAVGLDDQTNTEQAMTFTIVAKPTATSITVYPKPIAADDAALDDLEKSYSNVDTTILNGASVVRLNTVASERTNLFWDQDAVEVMKGNIPAQLFKEFAGMRVISEKLSNGQTMYMIYDANSKTMNVTFRMFVWYGITIKDPRRVGVSISFDA